MHPLSFNSWSEAVRLLIFLMMPVDCKIHVRRLTTSDGTGTVSGTVSARNNVGLVRSLNIFVPEPEHAIRPTKIGVSPIGKVGISKRESETDNVHYLDRHCITHQKIVLPSG